MSILSFFLGVGLSAGVFYMYDVWPWFRDATLTVVARVRAIISARRSNGGR